ncbi:MAG TPA: DUF418 domain-containing protein [Thermoanaerobaculia bacterium]|nr:DUF418 domain-containing protein [Thermoanaerobaculia bacterium]
MPEAGFGPIDAPNEEALPDAPSPVAPDERIALLDILRGFAIFGILVVNVLYFSQPIAWVVDSPFEGTWDRIATAVITIFFAGKFYSTFSMLFGVGFAIQLARAQRRGGSALPTYVRRLFWLLLIGLTHAIAIWYGDILHIYAILGFILILFRNARPRTLLIAAAISLMIPVALTFVGAAALSASPPDPDAPSIHEIMHTEDALRNYAEGTWSEIAGQRVRDWLMLLGFSVFFLPNVFAMFLVGFWAGRSEIHLRAAELRGAFRRVVAIALPLGLALNAIVYLTREAVDPTLPTWLGAFSQLAYAIGVPLLAVSYIAAVALRVTRPEGPGALAALAPLGRMALTNYLVHSVIGTLIFYGYGLGLYGKVGPWIAIPLAVVIVGLQIPLSRWWLSRFRFGPVEWLWRSATYGRMQRLMIEGR